MARRQKGGGFTDAIYALLVLVLVAGIILAVLGALGQLTPHSAPGPTPTPAPTPAPAPAPGPGPAPVPSGPVIPGNVSLSGPSSIVTQHVGSGIKTATGIKFNLTQAPATVPPPSYTLKAYQIVDVGGITQVVPQTIGNTSTFKSGTVQTQFTSPITNVGSVNVMVRIEDTNGNSLGQSNNLQINQIS